MSRANRHRGRPKGSGLDDTKTLKAVKQILASNPAMKPTTAIRSMGVSDPSSIRRLRDKLRAGGRTEIRLDRAAAAPSVRKKPAARVYGPDPQAAPQLAAPDTTPAAGSADVLDPQRWLDIVGGLGLQTVFASMEAQAMFLKHALELPHIAEILRGQLLFNEFAVAFCPFIPECRKTLH